MYIYDFDIVESVNLGGQLYNTNSLNASKVNALYNIVHSFTDKNINIFQERYTEDSMHNPIVFSAFDNIEARKIMFELWVDNYIKNPIFKNKACVFIDGRLLSESGKVFTVTKHNYEKYREYLYDDSTIKEQPCSFKATSHSAGIIAGLMVSAFNNYTTCIKENMMIRELPFLIEFELPLMSFTNTN